MTDVFGWLVVAIPGIPLAVLVVREVVSELLFAVWMRRHDRFAPPPPVALPAGSTLPPPRGMVIDAEVIDAEVASAGVR